MGNTAILFRLIAASVLVGLMAFCAAHVIQVWRKRNARTGAAHSSAARRLSWFCVIVGLILVPGSAMLRQFSRTHGELTGEGLFVVRARDTANVDWIHTPDTIRIGETLVRFHTDPHTEELKARLAQAETKSEEIGLQPLTPDPELARRQQEIFQERAQTQLEIGQAILATEAAGRDVTTQAFNKKEILVRLERSLIERKKDMERSRVRGDYARELLGFYEKLYSKGMVSATEYRGHVTSVRDADIERSALADEIKNMLVEKEVLTSQLAVLEGGKIVPERPLENRIVDLKLRLAKLEIEETELKTKITEDLARSTKLRELEKAEAKAKVQEYRAAVDGAVRDMEIRAPFTGRIAFRAPSPNAAPPRTSLAVLAPEKGFLLTARMPQADVDALREGGDVLIEVGEDTPERIIPAKFHHTAALSHEPDQSALRLECEPPPAIVRRLAEGERLTVTFSWYPPLLGMQPFRTGITLLVAGLLGLVLTSFESLRFWANQYTLLRTTGAPTPETVAYFANSAPMPVTVLEPDVPQDTLVSHEREEEEELVPLEPLEVGLEDLAVMHFDPPTEEPWEQLEPHDDLDDNEGAISFDLPGSIPPAADSAWFPPEASETLIQLAPAPDPDSTQPPTTNILNPFPLASRPAPQPQLNRWQFPSRPKLGFTLHDGDIYGGGLQTIHVSDELTPDVPTEEMLEPKWFPPESPPPPPELPPVIESEDVIEYVPVKPAEEPPPASSHEAAPTLAEVEASHKDTLVELNVSRTPQETSNHLEKLQKLRWVLRQLQPPVSVPPQKR